MLKNLKPRERKTEVYYTVDFDIDRNSGFTFPCDVDGNVLLWNDGLRQNYEHCLAHPEKFVSYNKVIRHVRHFTENARGTCICGAEVELYDQYYGACECEKCGRWYNLFGQELVAPKYWEEDFCDDGYDDEYSPDNVSWEEYDV